MRIAIIHDWLVVRAGAEKVLEQIVNIFPEADLFALVDFLPKGARGFLHDKPVTTSFLQHFPLARTKYRSYLPLMPLAIEQFDLSGYDLVISSSHAIAKGVITGPDQLHISYVHSPIRYAWDLQHQYLRETNLMVGLKGWLAKWFLHKIRIWDTRTSNGVDRFIANSGFIARRIYKVYHRHSTVIYPPVSVQAFPLGAEKSDFYLTASRMVPYKRIDLIVAAFTSMPQRKLVVIGEGPEYDRIKACAGNNISFLGYQPNEVLREHMQQARAFVFAAEEDFGIVPVEAQACGTPVIAYGRGGALETIRGLESPQPTGVFFGEHSIASLVQAVELFEANAQRIYPGACRDNALRFSEERFRLEFAALVHSTWADFLKDKAGPYLADEGQHASPVARPGPDPVLDPVSGSGPDSGVGAAGHGKP
jgi:glycosyltransferase involved in cell wall biosynthesis